MKRILSLEEAVTLLKDSNKLTQRLIIASMVLSVFLTVVKIWMLK